MAAQTISAGGFGPVTGRAQVSGIEIEDEPCSIELQFERLSEISDLAIDGFGVQLN